MNYSFNIMDDFDMDVIHETMRFNQLVDVYQSLDKLKIENRKLQNLVKYYKHETLFYKRYYDAIYSLILVRHDLSEFIKFIRRTFKFHHGVENVS